MTGEVREWISYLKEIGVRELHVRGAGVCRTEAIPVDPPAASPGATRSGPGDPATRLPGPAPGNPGVRLEEIRAEIGDCTRCKLHERRTQVVFGVGNPHARLMFVGEGPGHEEDLRGEPFVGRAGKKLDEMIVAIGLARADVYIANIVKCRPPGNRDPEADEIATCSPFLAAQIGAIRPRAIVTLGGPATKTLLRTKVGITRLRGTWHEYLGIPVMPTFHPAYVLRNYTQETRRRVWEDLKAARSRIDAE